MSKELTKESLLAAIKELNEPAILVVSEDLETRVERVIFTEPKIILKKAHIRAELPANTWFVL